MRVRTSQYLTDILDLEAELRAENKKAKEALFAGANRIFTTEIPYPNKREKGMLKVVTYEDNKTDIIYSSDILKQFSEIEEYVEYIRDCINKIYKKK